MEGVHAVLQLPACRRPHQQEDFGDARRAEPRSAITGADNAHGEADGRPRCRYVMIIARSVNPCVRMGASVPSSAYADFIFLFFSLSPSVRKGILCDLLWSDPDESITGWLANDRGVSFTFGPDIVSRFLQKHDLDLICRAHQVRISFVSVSALDERREKKTATCETSPRPTCLAVISLRNSHRSFSRGF